MTDSEPLSPSFDFQQHERVAISEYLKVRPFYVDLASVVGRILEECLKKDQIKVHSVDSRAKEAESFGRKAATPLEIDPNRPKYDEPLRQVTDLAGVRIITYVLGTVNDIDSMIKKEFSILEQSDKGKELLEEERFGYQSIHYLVRIKPERGQLAEYERFRSTIVEIQVRTILQHAWAEIEHDIQYKSSTAIPEEIRRRFMALAGMLEIADREFQSIQGTDAEVSEVARQKVNRGELAGVEITPQTLKQFLDRQLGPDGRISDWNYDWTARLLKRLGFRDLNQVSKAVANYDHNQLSTIAMGGRQGQTTRFELMLLAALGERYFERHMWNAEAWFRLEWERRLKEFQERGIPTSTYDPLSEDEPQSAPAAVSVSEAAAIE
jgi:putative GTP pyrophosphokinase